MNNLSDMFVNNIILHVLVACATDETNLNPVKSVCETALKSLAVIGQLKKP